MDTSHVRRKVIDAYGCRTCIENVGQFFNEEECFELVEERRCNIA